MHQSLARLKTKGAQKKLFIISFLAPAFLLYIAFFIYPAIDAIRISFTDWTGFGTKAVFNGLDNYSKMLGDEVFWTSLGNSFIFMICGGIIVFLLALVFAYLLTNYIVHQKFYLNIFYFPNLISFAALTILWVFIFDGTFGVLNSILKSLGLEQYAVAWLGSRKTGMAAITATGAWFYLGFYLILIYSGITKIPNSLFEAAITEGASRPKIFFKVTFPLIWEIMMIAVALWMINSLKLFEIVWGMTKGGPSMQTHVMGTYIYFNAFGTYQVFTFRLGYASTLAVALVLIITIAVTVFRRITTRETYEY